MCSKILNNKIIFVGDLKSINLEIVANSYKVLINKKIKIILIGELSTINDYFQKIRFKVKIIELFDINDHYFFMDACIFVFNTGSPPTRATGCFISKNQNIQK